MAITLHLYYPGVDGAARRFAGEMISSGGVPQKDQAFIKE